MDKMIYRKEAGKAQLVVETPEDCEGGYQFSMLRYNEPEGYLPVNECSEGMTRRLFYDVTGCNCLADMMIRGRMDASMIGQLIGGLIRALEQAEEYLLDGGRLCLDPAYIYYKKERFYFCYMPHKEPDFDREFRCLAEFIADHADQEDRRAVKMTEKITETAGDWHIDLCELKELSDIPAEEEEPKVILSPVQEPVESEDLPEDVPGLPWDDWHIEDKTGLFR